MRRRNPLDPFPSFVGAPAWGGTQGGVHTADTKDQAAAYANIKGEPPDYPVILVIDTQGLDREVDVDVVRAAKKLSEYLEREESVDEYMEKASEYLTPSYVSEGDVVQNWLFMRTEPSQDYVANVAFLEYLDDAVYPDDVFERAKTDDLTDSEKMAIWGQGRYMIHIDEHRIVGAYLMKPWYPRVLAVDPVDDTVAGVPTNAFIDHFDDYNLLFDDEQDTTDPFSSYKLVYGRDDDGNPHLEYHGTSWANLTRALPGVARKIEADFGEPPALDDWDEMLEELQEEYEQ
jgi:hypothetical protein